MASAESSELDLRPYVRICRGCCCGSASKHPGFDHDAQVDAISAVARIRIVGCVDECSESNVALVQFEDERATWIGQLHSAESTDALVAWLSSGNAATPPPEIADRVLDPLRRLFPNGRPTSRSTA